MFGHYTPHDNLYDLRFLARNLRSDSHPLKDAGKISFDILAVRDDHAEMVLLSYLNKEKSNLGLPDSVSFLGIGQHLRIESRPTFVLQTASVKLDDAYRDLAHSLKKLGYNMRELDIDK
jgi:hypothetical protein